MAPRDKAHVRKAMSAVKGVDTTPELILRKALWARGYRYRLHVKKLPGKPDIVFVSARVAVFVDGDYWHGAQWKTRGFKSLEDQMKDVSNSDYWIKKIKGNVERDKINNAILRNSGWKVVRIWESDIRKRTNWAVEKIVRAIDAMSRRKIQTRN